MEVLLESFVLPVSDNDDCEDYSDNHDGEQNSKYDEGEALGGLFLPGVGRVHLRIRARGSRAHTLCAV